jgi:hypothetical protein
MGPKKVTTLIKPPKVSSMTQEENEDIHNTLSKLEEQLSELSDKSNNWVNSQRKIQEIERNMKENKEEIQNSMKEMQNSMSSICQALDERLPKGDIKTQGNHENKGSIHVEQTANNKSFSNSESNSNSGANYGGGPKFYFLKIELKKFDGTKFFTWVSQIEQYFELHNITDDKKRIHIETLKFEIKPYQWYQWIVKRKRPLYHYTWGLFTRHLEAQYGKSLEHDYFSQLTRIKHSGDIEDYN